MHSSAQISNTNEMYTNFALRESDTECECLLRRFLVIRWHDRVYFIMRWKSVVAVFVAVCGHCFFKAFCGPVSGPQNR